MASASRGIEADSPITREYARRLQRLISDDAPESDTSLWVLGVLRDLCGWSERELKPQRRAPRGFIDWHARIGRDAIVHIEVKRAGRALGDDMIIKYLKEDASAAGRVFGVLTNGAEWQLWLGGRWFDAAGVDPVRIAEIGLGTTRDFEVTIGALGSLRETFMRANARARWLAEFTESEDVLDQVFSMVLRSKRTRASWSKNHSRVFAGNAPPYDIVWNGKKSDGRIQPAAVAAALVMRRGHVAKVVLGEMKRLTGDRRFGQTSGRIRAMQGRLAEMFPLPGGW